MKKPGIIKLYILFALVFALSCPINVNSEDYDGYGIIVNNIQTKKDVQARTIEGLTYVPLNDLKSMLRIETEVQEGKLLLQYKGQDFEPAWDAEKASSGTFENKGFIIGENGVLVSVPTLKDAFHFDVEILDDIKCIRIVTKPDVLETAQLMGRLSKNEDKKEKVAYLTFDDGLEGKITPTVLDILEQYDIKATFFIIGNTVARNKELLKRISDNGHSIGNHTYTHKKEIIYSGTGAFSAELDKTSRAIAAVTGKTPKLFRPPYGMNYIKSEAYRKALTGYKIEGWNIDSMDSRIKNVKSDQIFGYVRYGLQNKKKAIILMHCSSTRKETVKALPEIIEYLMDNGYEILPLE